LVDLGTFFVSKIHKNLHAHVKSYTFLGWHHGRHPLPPLKGAGQGEGKGREWKWQEREGKSMGAFTHLLICKLSTAGHQTKMSKEFSEGLCCS